LYFPDILPPKGTGIALGVTAMVVSALAFTFIQVKENFGMQYCFALNLVGAILGLLFYIFVTVETKGKS